MYGIFHATHGTSNTHLSAVKVDDELLDATTKLRQWQLLRLGLGDGRPQVTVRVDGRLRVVEESRRLGFLLRLEQEAGVVSGILDVNKRKRDHYEPVAVVFGGPGDLAFVVLLEELGV